MDSHKDTQATQTDQNQQNDQVVVKRGRGRPKGSGHSRKAIAQRNLSKILTLAAQGVPQSIISREVNLAPSLISRTLAQYSGLMQELEFVKIYREGKSELLDAAQLKVLKSLSDDKKLDEANLYQTAMAFDVLYKSNRLERGQSTANTSVAHKFTKVVNHE